MSLLCDENQTLVFMVKNHNITYGWYLEWPGIELVGDMLQLEFTISTLNTIRPLCTCNHIPTCASLHRYYLKVV